MCFWNKRKVCPILSRSRRAWHKPKSSEDGLEGRTLIWQKTQSSRNGFRRAHGKTLRVTLVFHELSVVTKACSLPKNMSKLVGCGQSLSLENIYFIGWGTGPNSQSSTSIASPWVLCKLGLVDKVTLPWESSPGPFPILDYGHHDSIRWVKKNL